MKNFPFYHSVFPDRPFPKWVASGLFGFLAGLVALPSLAATPPSSDNVPSSASPKKKPVKKNRPVHARQSPAGQSGNGKKTAAADWQKRQPFSHTGLTDPVKKTAHWEKDSTLFSYGAWNRLPPKPSVTVLPAIGKPDRSIVPASSVFAEKTADGMAEPSKTAAFGTNAGGATLSSDTTNPASRGYTVGPARFTVNYEKSNDRSRERMAQFLSGKVSPDIADNDLVESRSDRENWHLGMEYATGNGRVNAGVNYVRMKDLKNAGAGNDNSPDSADLKTFTVGYTYDVSEKTSFYGMVARTEYEKEAMAGYLRGNGFDEDSVTGFQLGVTHRF